MASLVHTTLALCDGVQFYAFERTGVGPDSAPHALATAARALAASIVGDGAAARPVPTPHWQWWSGSSEEWFEHGPFDTREEAVAELVRRAGYVMEATPPDRVSLCADALINAQYFEDNDTFDFDHSEPDRIGSVDVIAAADAELQALLDAWCARFGHTFARGNMFGATRNQEAIAAIASDDEVAA